MMRPTDLEILEQIHVNIDTHHYTKDVMERFITNGWFVMCTASPVGLYMHPSRCCGRTREGTDEYHRLSSR